MRILVVKLSSFGDILHVLPTVHALREQTGASIDWVVHPEFAALVKCFADIDKVITFPRHNVFRNLHTAVKSLQETEYDIAVDLHGLFKSGIVMHYARAKRKIAPSYAREFSWFFCGERAGKMRRTRHAAEQAMDTLDYLGLKRPADGGGIASFKPVDVQLPPGKTHIAFAPVSRWVTKNWPVSKFAELAKLLSSEIKDLALLVVGGNGDYSVGEEIAAAAPDNVTNLCGKTSIPESIAMLGKCDLLIANDTGPVHMAAAAGTRCLVIFGPTRPDWTGPYGKGHRVIMQNLPCQPCLKRKCRRGDLACMNGILPSDVAAVAKEMLGGI